MNGNTSAFRTIAKAWLAGPALAGLLTALPHPASGQGVQALDEGRYEIRVGGRRVGTESFAIRREGSAVKAVGRITLEGQAASLAEVDVRLQTDSNFRPTSYGLRARSGPVDGVDGVWNGDRLRLHLTTGQGERWKEFLTPGPVAILETGVAHHYFLLFRQLPRGWAGSSIAVVRPSVNEQATARITGGEEDPVQVGRERRSAVRYEVEVDGLQRTVWLDAEGRVLQVAFPEDDRIAVRLPEGTDGGP
jgi:hypothetical protein